jgi:hypothetical protein
MPFIVATYVYASSQGQRTHSAGSKILLVPMGSSLPGLRMLDLPLSLPSTLAEFFTRLCRVTFKYPPQPLRSHIQSFKTLGQLWKIPPVSAYSARVKGPLIFVWVGNLLFWLVWRKCKNFGTLRQLILITAFFPLSFRPVTFHPQGVIVGFWNFAWGFKSHTKNKIWGENKFGDPP